MTTFKVEFTNSTITMSGDVTACTKDEAIAAAAQAWGISELNGEWAATPKPLHDLVAGIY